MGTLTICVDDELKKTVQKISRKDGATLTFIVNQFFKNYINGYAGFFMFNKKRSELDEDIIFDQALKSKEVKNRLTKLGEIVERREKNIQTTKELGDFMQSSADDTLSQLEPLSEEEYNYYMKL